MRLVYLLGLLLLPELAHAAPVFTAVAAWWATLSTAAATLIVNVAITVGMAVYGSAQQRRAEREARDAFNASLKDRTITRIATEAPFRYIYGKARVGSDIVSILTSGDKDQYKHLVCVHAAHECESIDEVYINGKAIGSLDSNGVPVNISFTANTTSGWDQITSVSVSTLAVGMVVSGNGLPADTYIKNITGTTVTLSNKATASASGVNFLASYAYTKVSTEFITEGKSGATFDLSHVPNNGTLTVSQGYWGDKMYITPVSVVGKTVTLDKDYGSILCSYAYTSGTPTVRVQKHLGAPDQVADASLITDIPSKWDSTKTLSGLCYTVIRLDLNEAEFQGGVPSIEVLVKGKKLYDFRTGVTQWSDNNVLAIYDYLTSEMCGVDKNDLPKAQFITAANACDDILLSGIKRYTLNGTVTSDEDQRGVLERMARSMAGSIVSTTWDIYAGKYVAPIYTLDQTDIVGSISINPGVSDADLYNGVRGQYVSAETNYVADDYIPYQNAYYTAWDKVEKWTNIDFSFTDELQRVHNLCRIFTEDLRNGYTVKAEFSQKAWRVKVGDRVTLSSTLFGWDNKVFRVTDKQFSPTSAVELTLKEDAESIWDQADAILPDDTPNTSLPNPFSIDMLSAITVSSGNDTLLLMQDGTIVSRMLAVWPTATTQAVVNNGLIEVEWCAAGDLIWQKVQVSGSDTQTYLSPVEDGITYYVRARCVNPYFNVKSDWLYVTHTVIGKTQEPPDVTGFSVTTLADATRKFVFNTANQPVDVLHGGGFRIKYRDSASTVAWSLMTPLHDGLITQSPYETGSLSAGTYDFAIVAVDSSGNESVDAAFVDNVVISDTSIASSALAAANAAQASANTANAAIANITSDNVLSKGEKSEVILDYTAIINEQSGIDSQADAFGVSRTTYDTAVSALTTYLTGLSPAYNDTTADTTIVGSTFRAKFTDVYTSKQSLLNAIYAKAKLLADNAQGTANTAVTNAAAAQSAANAAQSDATNALTQLTSISSDNVLSKGEKSQVMLDYNALTGEQSGIDAQADTFSVSRTSYDSALSALTTYLTGLSPAYNDTTQDTTIVGTTFRTKFTDVYNARQALLNSIAAKAKTLADSAQTTANTAVSNAATAQSAADTANTLLADIANDNKLTPVEKSSVRSEWNIISAEVAPNDTQATTFGVTTEKATYDSAFQALATYLNNGTTWTSGVPSWISDANLSTTTVIVGSTFRSNFKAYYDARTALLNAIAAKAKTLADNAQSSANAVAADFNASNNRNGAAIVAPTIATDGTAVDHTLQKNGSADISFEWSWSGTNGDIDGFFISVYQSSSSSAYTFGTTPAAEQVFTVPANKRAFILFGAVADQYYSFAVQAYRSVDTAINSAGVITSTLVKATGSGENPYQPSTSVAFSGNVTGTVNGINAANVNQWSAIAGAGKPADNATVGATFGVNISGAITSSNSSTYIGSGAVATGHLADYAASQMVFKQDNTGVSGSLVVPGSIGYTGFTLLSQSITTTGSQVALDAFLNLTINFNSSDGAYVYVLLLRDGTSIGSGAYMKTGTQTDGTMQIVANPFAIPITLSVVDTTVTAGSHTYSLYINAHHLSLGGLSSSGTWYAAQRSLKIREIKK